MPLPSLPRPSSSWRALTASGLAAALVVMAGGRLVESWRFGPDDRSARAGAEREVRSLVERHAASLRAMVDRVGRSGEVARVLAGREDPAPPLFDLLTRAGLDETVGDRALTIYSAGGAAVAWFGRPSTLPSDRLSEAASLFVAPGPLGLRLVYVEPVVLPAAPAEGRRVGAIAAERVLSPDGVPPPAGRSHTLTTSFGRAAIHPRFEGAGGMASRTGLIVSAPSGEPLIEVEVAAVEIASARARWRTSVRGLALGLLALALLVGSSPLFEWRRRARSPAGYLLALAGLMLAFVAARVLAWHAVPTAWLSEGTLAPAGNEPPVIRVALRSAVDLLLTGLLGAACVALLADAVQRARLGSRASRRHAMGPSGTQLRFVTWQLGAGTAAALLLAGFEELLGATVAQSAFDVLHLSLHPWDPQRLSVTGGVLALQAATAWAVVLLFSSALIPWRVPRRHLGAALLVFAGWLTPGGVLLVVARARGWDLPAGSVWFALAVSAVAAWYGARGLGWYRHGSQALRLAALGMALVVPGLLLYPSFSHFAHRQRQHLIEAQYAQQAMDYPDFLQRQLHQALDELDRAPGLAARIEAIQPTVPPQTDAAFLLWQHTVLAVHRLTSAVELYDRDGRLVSRFALNFPEYASRTPTYVASTCGWEVFGEAAPFGAEERRMLHAERGICGNAAGISGTIVVHLMPDYSVLPFISSQGPYFEFFHGPATTEARRGGDVGLVVYGWGRTTIYTSTGRAWVLGDELFNRIYRSRDPFWTTVTQGRSYRVHFSNDRAAIYAVDYPLPSLFDHLVRLAELITLAALAFVVLIVAGSLVRRLVWPQARPGQRLLREIRTSFYRKLFLAFVLAAVVPVVTLSFLTRAYFAARLRADVEAEAGRTVAVAQRLVEDAIAERAWAETGAVRITDEELLSVSRALGQDVNVFVGPQLVATSERDLFASGLLPTRVPDSVYRAIVLRRQPGFVGADEIADVRYLMAAAPLPAAGRDTILTMPLASRQREIEREIDDLDRGVQLSALVFILLGAGIGFWMAERIGDPVTRLTRASRRIAAGDLDARVFVRTADELQRLVESFNSMAYELKRQRAQLERTNRLEAWAEMARQVAHDIKNPLTPIQLSAEHLRRVHDDQGAPLTPVLENCIDTILTQVRLLRQIAGEFSSFASTPSPRPVPTDVGDLLREVLQAYAAGLADRVGLSLQVDEGLPALQLDRTLIGRAVTNVVENALHAMPGGGALSVRAAQEDGAVVITVRDTGVGMDEEALSRIFEPYFSTKAIGTGLGLTIARRNVELHGGSIDVESRRGEGTTVKLTLPIDSR